MGQQRNKVEKRSRRKAYISRVKARTLAAATKKTK